MTMPPKEYLRARRRELAAQIQSLNEELKDLERMESALTGQQFMPGLDTQEAEKAPRHRRRFEGGIKGMVLFVLATEGRTMAALAILSGIKKHFGAEIERTSLSPQLTRLKTDRLITLEDDGWLITADGVEVLNDLELKPQTPGRE